jgi:hypothetical protein
MQVTKIQPGLPLPPKSIRRVILENDRKGNSILGNAVSLLRHRFWLLNLYRHALLSESRTIFRRTKFRFDKRLDQTGVDFGTSHQNRPNGHLGPCIRTQLRIRDTQSLLAKMPWATLVDLHLFLVGWDRGEQSRSADADIPYIQG